MYTPLQGNPKSNYVEKTTTMASKGINLDVAPQFLDLTYALNIENYLPSAEGYLKKRLGLSRQYNVGGTSPFTMIKEYTDNVFLVAYGTTLIARDLTAATSTTIKSDFTSDTFAGSRYGDYFFITSKLNGLWRVSQTLAYDTQTANFTTGKTLTGATSGATATILEDADSGVTGTLTLGNISGTFQAGEIITDSATGSATTSGTVGYAITEVSAAPKASVIEVINNRIILGDLEEDESAVHYSEADDGTNPPFTNWTVGTDSTDPGKLYYRNGGKVNTIRSLGTQIIVGQERGKFAFSIDIFDSGGTVTKIDNGLLYRQDYGMARGAIVTDDGLFYANEAGLWQLVSVGQTNVPFSNQETDPSELLGDTYFDDIDLTNADIAYDARRKLILLTCAKNSNTNNFVIVYNIKNKAFSFITGWQLNRFVTQKNVIWASDASTARLYKVFDGYSDDGEDISCDYEQEINTGSYYNKMELVDCYVQGFLSTTSSIKVRFDIYDEEGAPETDRAQFTWTAQRDSEGQDGYGQSIYGSSSYGADPDLSGTIESFDGCKPFVRGVQRLRLHITSQGQEIHSINWVSLGFDIGARIRRRKMERITS